MRETPTGSTVAPLPLPFSVNSAPGNDRFQLYSFKYELKTINGTGFSPGTDINGNLLDSGGNTGTYFPNGQPTAYSVTYLKMGSVYYFLFEDDL